MKKLRDKRGAALVWAVASMLILSIILMAMMSISLAYHGRSLRDENARQAYLTARAAVDTVAAVLEGLTPPGSSYATEDAAYEALAPWLPRVGATKSLTDFDLEPGTLSGTVERLELACRRGDRAGAYILDITAVAACGGSRESLSLQTGLAVTAVAGGAPLAGGVRGSGIVIPGWGSRTYANTDLYMLDIQDVYTTEYYDRLELNMTPGHTFYVPRTLEGHTVDIHPLANGDTWVRVDKNDSGAFAPLNKLNTTPGEGPNEYCVLIKGGSVSYQDAEDWSYPSDWVEGADAFGGVLGNYLDIYGITSFYSPSNAMDSFNPAVHYLHVSRFNVEDFRSNYRYIREDYAAYYIYVDVNGVADINLNRMPSKQDVELYIYVAEGSTLRFNSQPKMGYCIYAVAGEGASVIYSSGGIYRGILIGAQNQGLAAISYTYDEPMYAHPKIPMTFTYRDINGQVVDGTGGTGGTGSTGGGYRFEWSVGRYE